MNDTPILLDATLLANKVAFECLGYRNSCIITSYALVEHLRRRGIIASPVRVEVHNVGAALGWGSDRPMSSDGWPGHLAVECGDYVLDPTLDQVPRLEPMVFLKPEGWDSGAPYRWMTANCSAGFPSYYERHRRQNGWKTSGAARSTSWRWIADRMEQA